MILSTSLFLYLFYFMFMSVLPACIPHVCLTSWISEDRIETPGIVVSDSCESPCGFWEQNLDPMR